MNTQTSDDHLGSPQKYYFAACILGLDILRCRAESTAALWTVFEVMMLIARMPRPQIAGNGAYVHLRQGVQLRCCGLSLRGLSECCSNRPKAGPAEHLSHAWAIPLRRMQRIWEFPKSNTKRRLQQLIFSNCSMYLSWGLLLSTRQSMYETNSNVFK